MGPDDDLVEDVRNVDHFPYSKFVRRTDPFVVDRAMFMSLLRANH